MSKFFGLMLALCLGKAWYLGAMTGDRARTEKVSPQFLGTRRWRATV